MKRFLPFIAPIACVLWLVGCGGGSDGSGGGATPTPSHSPTPTPTPVGTRAVKVMSVTPAVVSASGNQTVTIAGEGFSGRTELRVHNIPLKNLVVVSDTEIVATTVAVSFDGLERVYEVFVVADGISSYDSKNRFQIKMRK